MFAALNPGDVDAELERLDIVHHIPMINPAVPEGRDVEHGGVQPAPRPLSPTRLQPVITPEAQTDVMPDLEELLRIRAEIPRPLKRRGSVDQSRPMKKASHYQPNQYRNLINKLFHKKERRHKGEQGSESGSSSEGEDCAMPPDRLPVHQTSTPRFYDIKVRRVLQYWYKKKDFFLYLTYFCPFRTIIQFCGGPTKPAKILESEHDSAPWSCCWTEH